MQTSKAPASYRHGHNFNDGNPLGEKNVKRAMWLTVAMMIAEIIGGYVYNSMALLADGWHMSSHALALGLSAMTFAIARRLSTDSRFAFGTWKIEVLGGYTSAILLLLVAAIMLVQSVQRLFAPVAIHYNEAIAVAAVGLAVNLICAW
jgi:cation diffusion facilitator family transporter